MGVREFRQAAAFQKQEGRERRALLREVWPVAPHWCGYCGKYVKHQDASAHHLVSREQGGSDRAGNLVIVHLERCHDAIELWTEKKGRPPQRDELGRLSGEQPNLLTPGVGTQKQEQPTVAYEAPLSVDDIPRYLRYFAKLNRDYEAQIRKNPQWGMWVYDERVAA